MGHLNNDVVTLIRNIVNKNKINRCNKSYHEQYEIIEFDNNNESYFLKPRRAYHIVYYAFNYRNISYVNLGIFKIGKPIFRGVLPKNY